MKKSETTPAAERIQVLCKEVARGQGENRGGRYYVTDKLVHDAVRLIHLVERRKSYKKAFPDAEREKKILALKNQSDPIWDDLRANFNALNPELGEAVCNIAYKHFMITTRKSLGYKDIERKPWELF